MKDQIKEPNPDLTQVGTTAQISHFTLEKQIGKGQFSTVFKAKDNNTGTMVALKRVPIFEMTDPKSRNDCIKEIDLLRNLDHPNVIRQLDSFIENTELVIVLELADAGDLSKMIQRFKFQNAPMPEKTIWKYFVQISGGLAHMHQRRIMHRDLKPANVFLTAQGSIKLGDLGLGTPYYMSPERIHETAYSFKSDVWGLGCMLYEMAALHSPFYGDKMSLYSLCQKIDKVEYPTLDEAQYSKELRDLVSMMIQVDADARPDIEFIHKYATDMHLKMNNKTSMPSPLSPVTPVSPAFPMSPVAEKK